MRQLEEICNVAAGFTSWQPDWMVMVRCCGAQRDIDNAIDFIRRIPFAIETPEAMVAGDGDVGFRWRKGDIYIEVGFIEGTISFVVRTGVGDEYIGGDEEYKGFVPDSLQQGMARTIKT